MIGFVCFAVGTLRLVPCIKIAIVMGLMRNLVKKWNRERDMVPPKILTNNYWPVRQKILSHLSFYDKRALGEAFPGLKIQEDATYKRQELLNQIFGDMDFGRPHLNTYTIVEKLRMGGSERAKKIQEINQYFSDIFYILFVCLFVLCIIVCSKLQIDLNDSNSKNREYRNKGISI